MSPRRSVFAVTVVKRPVSPEEVGAAICVWSATVAEVVPLVPICPNIGTASKTHITKVSLRLRRNKSHLLKFRTAYIRIV
jgi:hypothetical protein